ncbi:MAG: hemolysin III family protein [Azospirillaceae bacterium]|nr:hemolysin III family protein [Azospirillaceae bacterium]
MINRLQSLPTDPRADDKDYSPGERIANIMTHGTGAVLSIVGLAVLISFAAQRGVRPVVALAIYGSCLVLLYLASTGYHWAKQGRAKNVLKVCDHSAIYLAIAGTYTPFAMLVLGGGLGWALLATIWALAILGVLFKILLLGRFEALSIASYLLLGWVGAAVAGPITSTLAPAGIVWLVVGGLVYSGGVAFYRWERLPYNHAIWHLFVLGGSACHFVSILCYVLPASA